MKSADDTHQDTATLWAQETTHPRVWALVDQLEAEATQPLARAGEWGATMALLDAAEANAAAVEDPQTPGLAMLTGLSHDKATEAEVAAWTKHCQEVPGAAHKMASFSLFLKDADETEDTSASLAALLARGEALSAILSTLPAALQAGPEDALLGAQSADVATFEAPLALTSTLVAPDVAPDIAAPEPSALPALGTSAPPRTSWAALSQIGLGMLAFVCVLWAGGGAPVWDSPEAPSAPRIMPLGPLHTTSKGAASKQPPQPATARLHFDFFVRRNKVIRRIRTSYKAAPGDQLRFAYRFRAQKADAKPLFLLLFMMDRRGQVSHLYPAGPHQSFPLQPTPKGPDILLPTGATLDSIDGPERLFVCVTKQRLSYQRATSQLRALLKRRSIVSIKRFPRVLGCVYQRSWLLVPGKKR